MHLLDSLDSQIKLNFIELCLAIRITFVMKQLEFEASQRTEMQSITGLFITCDQEIGLSEAWELYNMNYSKWK